MKRAINQLFTPNSTRVMVLLTHRLGGVREGGTFPSFVKVISKIVWRSRRFASLILCIVNIYKTGIFKTKPNNWGHCETLAWSIPLLSCEQHQRYLLEIDTRNNEIIVSDYLLFPIWLMLSLCDIETGPLTEKSNTLGSYLRGSNQPPMHNTPLPTENRCLSVDVNITQTRSSDFVQFHRIEFRDRCIDFYTWLYCWL